MDGKLFVWKGILTEESLELEEDPYEQQRKDKLIRHKGKYDKDSQDVIFNGRLYYKVVNSVPNFKGQKYLIAPKNYRGELQGDEHLICCDCSGTSDSDKQETASNNVHFRISVDDKGCFWIFKDPSGVDNKDAETIQLNEDKVTVEGWQMNFGDDIKVIAGNEDEDKELHRFRFDMIENKEGHVNMKSPSDNFFFPGYIHSGHGLIFHEIISYLSFNDLKNARQINRLWEEEITTILMKKATVSLFLEEGTTRSLQGIRMTLLRFAKEVGYLVNRKKLFNLDIYLPLLRGDSDFTDHELNQTLQDFNRYFLNLEGLQESVKQLRIKGGLISEGEGGVIMRQLWRGMLEKFQNVEYLALDVDASLLEEGGDGAVLPDLSALHYSKLKSLELSSGEWFDRWNRGEIGVGVMIGDVPAIKTWIDDCIRAVPKVEFIDFFMFPLAHLFLEEINKAPYRLPKLSGLNLGLLHPSNVSQLLAIRNETLTYLQIQIFEETPITAEQWQQLFKAQGPNLQHLALTFNRKDTAIPCIKLPAVFPKLETLEILEYPENLEVTLGTSKPGDLVDYSKTFPKLKQLSLFPSKYYYYCDFLEFASRLLGVWEEDDDAVWNAFLGTSNPCTTLKTLKIPHLGEDTPVEKKVWDIVVCQMSVDDSKWDWMKSYYKDIKRIATLFPAVQHDWIVEIRNGGDPEGEDPDGEVFGLVEKLMWKIPIFKPY